MAFKLRGFDDASGAAALNQVWERDTGLRMRRTLPATGYKLLAAKGRYRL